MGQLPEESDPENDYSVPLDEIAQRYRVTDDSDEKAIFYRITLPWVEAGSVMDLLSQEGISAATIYPGFKGVGDTLKDEDLRGG